MIWALLAAHVSGCALLAAVGNRIGRSALWVAAIPPALTSAWALGRLGDDGEISADATWVAGLDLSLAFSVGPFAALMTLVVSGIGVAVFVYSAGYFSPDAPGLGRFATTLLAFSAAMLGLVWADHVWTLFVFWELTSVTSFLLIGHTSTDPATLGAARRALLVTAAGGLVLLAGFVVLADAAGTARISEMPSATGTGATVAAVLVMVAAATKSAQLPFHVWLPGAMLAPTPVSAYLHSATMVKAGVVLVALAGPVLGDTSAWKPLGLALGLGSTVWGAIGALRHDDAKAILAWGTISQLGLMIALLSVGTGKATFAAVAILAAHAIFKAALFMVVGEIDARTGTRDITELSGLWRTMPAAGAVAVVSGASMAGVPPMLGFAAKEAAVEAVLGLTGAEAWIVGGLVVGGSALTVAYTVRLIVGLFGSAGESTAVAAPRAAMSAPILVLGVGSIAGFVGLGAVTDTVRPAAVQIDPGAEVYELLRWPGLTDAFLVSLLIVAFGAGLGAMAWRRQLPRPTFSGEAGADRLVDGVLGGARLVTRRVQHGSLPIYLATMAAVAAVAATPFVLSIDPDALYRWDSGGQAVLAVLAVAAAAGAAAVDSRLGAALGLGVVGLTVAGLFVTHGAPDLALTQLLVETVVVVGFVVALGHLTRRFPGLGDVWRALRIGVATLVGVAMAAGLAATASNPSGSPPRRALADQAVDEGGGNNVVNVILTDVRALDTLGEVVVLAVVAVGILSLAARPRPTAPVAPPGDPVAAGSGPP